MYICRYTLLLQMFVCTYPLHCVLEHEALCYFDAVWLGGLPAAPTWASVGGKTAQGFQPIPPGQVSEEKLPCFRATLAASWSTPCVLLLRQMFVCTYLGSLSCSFSVPLQTFLHLLHHLLVIYTIQYIQNNMCKCNTQYNICNTICANVFTIHYAIYANVSTIQYEFVDPLADPFCSGEISGGQANVSCSRPK